VTPELKAAISRLGAGEYKDGSSTKPGWLYQPMGDFFHDLRDVPVHSAKAVRHTFEIIKAHPTAEPGALLDFGCSTGYYLKLPGYHEHARYGWDADENAVAVAKVLGLVVNLWTPAILRNHFYPKPVTALFLNCHMWAHKAGVADEMMAGIAQVADRVFFQTAGLHSAGRYRVLDFTNMEDERLYLSRWFGSIEHLDANPHHGGIRHLWLLQNPKRS